MPDSFPLVPRLDSWVSKGQETSPTDSAGVAAMSGGEESQGGPSIPLGRDLYAAVTPTGAGSCGNAPCDGNPHSLQEDS